MIVGPIGANDHFTQKKNDPNRKPFSPGRTRLPTEGKRGGNEQPPSSLRKSLGEKEEEIGSVAKKQKKEIKKKNAGGVYKGGWNHCRKKRPLNQQHQPGKEREKNNRPCTAVEKTFPPPVMGGKRGRKAQGQKKRIPGPALTWRWQGKEGESLNRKPKKTLNRVGGQKGNVTKRRKGQNGGTKSSLS